jgi:hypothetical protein
VLVVGSQNEKGRSNGVVVGYKRKNGYFGWI